jgi:hypothetical protein
MRSDTDALAAQNRIALWIDCNAHGLGHRWRNDPTIVDGLPLAYYWHCARCPVDVRTLGKTPLRFLN